MSVAIGEKHWILASAKRFQFEVGQEQHVITLYSIGYTHLPTTGVSATALSPLCTNDLHVVASSLINFKDIGLELYVK